MNERLERKQYGATAVITHSFVYLWYGQNVRQLKQLSVRYVCVRLSVIVRRRHMQTA